MSNELLTSLSGKFVVFDGPDGCGKTTQLKTLIAKLDEAGVKVRRLREPGGTPIGEQIRELLLSTKNSDMDVRCEMLLYMASRAQLVQEHIRPALAAGECVVADRFASSTLAYQGGGGGMDVEQIVQVANIAVGDTWPDLTVVFDLDTEQAMARLNPLWSGGTGKGRRKDPDQAALFHDDQVKDRIEQRAGDYFQRVRENYLWQARQWPERYRVIDAGKSVAQVEKLVMKTLADFSHAFELIFPCAARAIDSFAFVRGEFNLALTKVLAFRLFVALTGCGSQYAPRQVRLNDDEITVPLEYSDDRLPLPKVAYVPAPNGLAAVGAPVLKDFVITFDMPRGRVWLQRAPTQTAAR